MKTELSELIEHLRACGGWEPTPDYVPYVEKEFTLKHRQFNKEQFIIILIDQDFLKIRQAINLISLLVF